MGKTPVGNELFSGADRNSIPVSAVTCIRIFSRNGHDAVSFYAPVFGLVTISIDWHSLFCYSMESRFCGHFSVHRPLSGKMVGKAIVGWLSN
jgi:hypothetical protein